MKICILFAILIILIATTFGSSHYFSEALSVQFTYNRVNLLWHWIPFHYTYTEKSVLLLFYHCGNCIVVHLKSFRLGKVAIVSLSWIVTIQIRRVSLCSIRQTKCSSITKKNNKGQLISKELFAILKFFQKTNETIRS